MTGSPTEPPSEPPSERLAEPSEDAAAAGAGGLVAARHQVGEAVGRLGTFTRATADKAQLRREQVAARRAAEKEARRANEHSVHLSDIPDDDAPVRGPGPLLHFDPEEKPGAHSNLVLGIVAGVVVVSFLVAMLVLVRGFSGNTEARPATASASPGASSASTAGGAPPLAPTPAPSAAPVKISRGVSIDPYGDGSENDDQIPRAYDGDPATRWQSEQYVADPGWGGSGNRGVGLAFQLATPATLQKVRLTFGQTGQTGQVYVGPNPQLQGATKVGDFSGATGTTEVTLTPASQAKYVIVWFTKAVRESGGFRVSLNEIVPLG